MSAAPIFTGSSSYSKDLQNVISRSVAIASLPLNQLTDDKAALSKQNDEMTTMAQKVADVRAAIDGIGQALDSSFDTNISDATVLSATTGPGAIEGNYSVLVSDAGAYSTMMTGTWSTPAGAPKTYKLWIGADSYDVTGGDNSAASVAAAINRSYGDKVHATVVNVGPAATPDYRISLQSVALTTEALDLTDGVSLASQQAAGRPAQYEVNHSGRTVASSTRTVSISDGVTLTLLKSSLTAANVTVTRSTSALNDALGKLVDSYNAIGKELDAQRGTGTGPLQGNPVVSALSSAVTGLATYSSTGAFSGLRDMGIELQKDGTLKQNQFQLIAMDLTNSAGVTSFFESFVAAADTVLDGLDSPTSGLVAQTASALKAETDELTHTMAAKQAQIDDLQQRLTEQMAAADALLATMEQQYSYMSSMFSAMQTAAQQYK
jgi:flagellar hook-associated protein 2